MRKLHRTYLRVASDAGMAEPRIDYRGGKHPRIIGEVAGTTRHIFIGGSKPGDRRAQSNTFADIRRRIRQWRQEAA